MQDTYRKRPLRVSALIRMLQEVLQECSDARVGVGKNREILTCRGSGQGGDIHLIEDDFSKEKKYELRKGIFTLFEFESHYWIPAQLDSDNGVLRLHNCTLKIPIGQLGAGDFVPTILIDFSQKKTLQVFNGEKTLLSKHCYDCIYHDLAEKKILASDFGNTSDLMQINLLDSE